MMFVYISITKLNNNVVNDRLQRKSPCKGFVITPAKVNILRVTHNYKKIKDFIKQHEKITNSQTKKIESQQSENKLPFIFAIRFFIFYSYFDVSDFSFHCTYIGRNECALLAPQNERINHYSVASGVSLFAVQNDGWINFFLYQLCC